MTYADFVHLRVHTSFSLSEGALRIDDLVKLCAAQSIPAVAMTDNGNLFGAMEFSAACAGAGVQPIIGAILAIGEPTEPGQRQQDPTPIVVLAQNDVGYRHLVKLVSISFLDTAPGERPRVTWSKLEGLSD